jgi:hypothetical protein
MRAHSAAEHPRLIRVEINPWLRRAGMAVAGAVAAAIFIHQLPELRRYIKMELM